jgi:hypothetical protein
MASMGQGMSFGPAVANVDERNETGERTESRHQDAGEESLEESVTAEEWYPQSSTGLMLQL